MSFTMLDLIALGCIAFIGLPHGAFDGGIAVMLGWHKKRHGLGIFMGLYTIIAAAVIGLWIIFPILSLALFLVISMIHFGLGDNQFISLPAAYQQGFFKFVKVLSVCCHGGLVTIALPYFHPDEARQILQILSGASAASVITVIQALFPVWLALVVFYLGLSAHLKVLRGFAFEIIILSVFIWLLPPLAGFALYFCGIHTARHLISLMRSVTAKQNTAQHLKLGALFSVMSWGAGGVGFLALRSFSDIQAADATLQIVFIGLASLTVPHMLLVDMIFRPHSKTSRIAKI